MASLGSVTTHPLDTGSETLLGAIDEGVAVLTLSRPERRNALSAEMIGALARLLAAVEIDDAIGCVVLTGAGGAFCSGADLTQDAPSATPPHPWYNMRHVGDVAMALHRLPQPTIAKVGGVAAGAGCNLALGCDLIVASSEARFSEIFARRGLSVDFGGSWLLPRLVGLHRAKELAFFADIISADEAEAMGLVNRVVPAAELDAFVDGWATRLAAGPPIALAQTKRILNNSLEVSMEQALEDEGWAQSVNFSTSATPEAMAAFVEKRQPRFRGR